MSGTMSRSYRLSGTLSRSYNNIENIIKRTLLGNVGRSILAGLLVLLGGVLGLFPAKSGKLLGPTLSDSTLQSSKQWSFLGRFSLGLRGESPGDEAGAWFAKEQSRNSKMSFSFIYKRKRK